MLSIFGLAFRGGMPLGSLVAGVLVKWLGAPSVMGAFAVTPGSRRGRHPPAARALTGDVTPGALTRAEAGRKLGPWRFALRRPMPREDPLKPRRPPT